MIRTKKIEVVPYDTKWPKEFASKSLDIQKTLGNNFLEIHHIGSTSIPGLSAKPCIDIALVVKNLNDSVAPLESMGYICKGELNIPLRYFFVKKDGMPSVLHVIEKTHHFTKLNLCFRDYLRDNPNSSQAYANLKKEILKTRDTFEVINGPFTEYTLQKNQFIRNILDKSGFNEINIVFCLHHKDWEDYHRIKEEQIFSQINIPYDRNHQSLTAPNHFHFIMYKGTKVLGIAHIEFLGESEAALRGIAIDTPHKKQGYGAYLLKFLERWIKNNGRNVIKLHSARKAENFYKKFGYNEMKFEDISINLDIIDLGKTL